MKISDKQRLDFIRDRLSDVHWDHIFDGWVIEGTGTRGGLRKAIDSAIRAAAKGRKKRR